MFFILRVTVGFMLALSLHGCVHRGPSVTAVQMGQPLQEVCIRYNVDWTWDGVTQVVILEYKGNKAKALVGSDTVLVGKEKIKLSAPLRRSNSTIYVPEDFETKVITPFGAPSGVSIPKMDVSRLRAYKVIIDPGHGGRDPGAQGRSGVKEKEVVLDIAKRVKMLLEEASIQVVMTRHGDEFISLAERTEIASNSDADIFVSIHANSNPMRKMQGMESYYVKTQHKNDLDENQRQKNEEIFVKKLNMKYSPLLGHVVADMMYVFKAEESVSLAQSIVQQGSEHVQTPNRGARTCRFFVVRNTLIPAVLVEVGFLTNRQEEKRLNMPSYRQKIAEAIAHSVIRYANDS